ncbi:MAG: glycosyltransferase family 2 protein [Patescibacteria group bacterium]
MLLSVIIPILNEEEVLPELLRRLAVASAAWGEYELIFVDDGSRDTTFRLLREAAEQNPRIRVIKFARNFGHQIALSAGLVHAKGDAVAMIDGDLQDPPEFISEMLVKWREGFRIVYAVRKHRKEHLLKRMAYKGFYRLLHALATIDIPLDTGDFSLLDRRVVDCLNALPEHNRFLRGLRAWSGFSSIGIPYERESRFAGAPKYTMRKLFRLALDGIIGFSIIPLKLSTYLGFLIAGISFIAGIVLVVMKFTVGISLLGWTSLMVALFFLGGIQLLVLGIIGEYLGRMFIEAQNRPLYIVEETCGFPTKI